MTQQHTASEYPSLTLWNLDAPGLAVVNEDDLQIPSRFQQLGLTSSETPLLRPTADGEEIAHRQALLRFFGTKEGQRLKRILRSSDFAGDPSGGLLPKSEQPFLDHFRRGRSSYLRLLSSVLSILDSTPENRLPERLRAFRVEAAQHFDRIESRERELYDLVSAEITRAAEISGSVTFRVTQDGAKAERTRAAGYRLYSHDRFEQDKWTVPEKLRDSFLLKPLELLVRGAVKLQNRWCDERSYGPLVIDEVPDVFLRQLREFIDRTFKHHNCESPFRVRLFFSYSGGDELFVRIVRLHPLTKEAQIKLSYQEEHRTSSEAKRALRKELERLQETLSLIAVRSQPDVSRDACAAQL
jgi:hypothetical protein